MPLAKPDATFSYIVELAREWVSLHGSADEHYTARFIEFVARKRRHDMTPSEVFDLLDVRDGVPHG